MIRCNVQKTEEDDSSDSNRSTWIKTAEIKSHKDNLFHNETCRDIKLEQKILQTNEVIVCGSASGPAAGEDCRAETFRSKDGQSRFCSQK